MTRLKALELFGFKSFADRTRFEFPEGVTVVVGPNGSGKSNVVDAIKWVLGEQSVRSLRGKEMADVIFAGSVSRRPLNSAEVSLIFDNSAGLLPVEAAEVQIMRRVQRSGESEYLVNGETSRLRDIRELLSGTGAATEAYSVIEQGRVDALLVASGRERRAVFEEAAGITRFRSRRAEALRRLERAEQSRQRLADITGEVSSRLETVKHQAARARRWRQMTDRLRELRIAAAMQDLAAADAAVSEVDALLAATRAESGAVDGRMATTANEVAAFEASAADLLPGISAARSACAADTQRAAATEATLSLQRTLRADVEKELVRTAAALDTARAADRAAAAAEAEAAETSARLAARLDAIAARLAACAEAAQGTHHEATDHRERLTEAARLLDERRQEMIRTEAEVGRAEERAAEARQASDSAREAVATAHRQRARCGEAIAAWQGNVTAVQATLDDAARDVVAAEEAHRAATATLAAARDELSAWNAKLEACRERHTILQEIVARQEGLSDASRRLLASDEARVPGLTGALADLIVASIEWAPVVDLALGSLGQSLVVESLDAAVHWHAEWAAGPAGSAVLAAGGRISFVAIDSLRDTVPFDPGPHPGLVGRLDTLVLADHPESTGHPVDLARLLLGRLLGRVWIVDRIEHALPLLPAAPPGTLFMTRVGHALSADGVFEVGAAAAAAGLVARRSELRAVEQRRDEIYRTVAAATQRLDALQKEADRLQDAVRQAHLRRQQAAEAIATSRAELERTRRDERTAEAAVLAATADQRAADQRAAAATTALQTARAALATAAAALDTARVAARQAESAMNDLERSRSELVDEIHRLRIDEATCREKLALGRDTATALAATRIARCGDVDAARADVDRAGRRLEAYELELLAAGGMHAEAVAGQERSATRLADLEAEAEGIDARRRLAAAALEQLRGAAARLADAVHAHGLGAGEARHRRARIVERIRDEYDIDIEAVMAERAAHAPADQTPTEPLPDLPAVRADLDREIEELRRKLATMTSVNLEALAEAEELATRLATLEAQLADVAGAKESIEQLIARIDDESRRLLGDTIETVRGHFRDLFERLFGGGQADIVLEPGVDLLETAVEIVARPPGKEPRSISLLSGGEKTMTCVALLLSIFRSRPSPFCVLDEVDAALDEANVDRFVAVLRDFLSATQFIVVTHSKKTMAAATTLYGVTMEESGVSKRVSVRFESTAAAMRPVARAA